MGRAPALPLIPLRGTASGLIHAPIGPLHSHPTSTLRVMSINRGQRLRTKESECAFERWGSLVPSLDPR